MKNKIPTILIMGLFSWWGFRMVRKYFFTDNNREKDLLARTIYGEARGEGESGMKAVANVIMNRVNSGKWYGKTVEEVVLKPYQFSCWNENDPNRRVIMEVTETNATFKKAKDIAGRAINGTLEDKTGGATHYHAANITPYWAGEMDKTAKIGNHIFYREA